jgi:hypothetical protein
MTKPNRMNRMLGIAAMTAIGVGGTFSVASAQSTTTPASTPTPVVGTAAPKPAKTKPTNGGRDQHDAVIAKALGITPTELQTELAAGKTIAQIATAKGVNLQTVIDAFVADEMAEHPDMTKEEATARVTARVNGRQGAEGGGRRHGKRGGRDGGGRDGGGRDGGGRDGGGRDGGGRGIGSHAAVVAKALGMTTAELQTELDAGKTIAQIATAKGVNLQTVIDAFVADEMAEHPDMTKEDATARVTAQVNGVKPIKA